MNPLCDTIAAAGVLPVFSVDNVEDATPAADALYQGGIQVIEIVLRTETALPALSRAAAGKAIVGAGTVRTTEQARAAIDAGAAFIVSPGLSAPVVEYCHKQDIPIFPGVNSTYAVEQALHMGCSVLKFFPAEASGGAAMVKALAAPYPELKFIPTGGITLDNLAGYTKLANVLACGGTWITSKTIISSKSWSTLSSAAQTALTIVQMART
jgi:Entner-Doudoroff aldolase